MATMSGRCASRTSLTLSGRSLTYIILKILSISWDHHMDVVFWLAQKSCEETRWRDFAFLGTTVQLK